MKRLGFVRLRQGILIGVLVLVIALSVNLKVSSRRYNRELLEEGDRVIEKYNREHPLEPTQNSSGTYTDIEVSCTRRFILFGTPIGRIVLNVNPRDEGDPAELDKTATTKLRDNPMLRLVYIYERRQDGWKFLESYSEH